MVAKEKDCEDLKLWRPAIINHLYWTAASTPDGNPEVMDAKWKSMLSHIQDIHEHDTPAFPRCAHPPLEGEQRNKEWLEPGMKYVNFFFFDDVTWILFSCVWIKG